MKFPMLVPTFASILLLSLSAQAFNSWIGQPVFGGTGCPANETYVQVSPDGRELSLIADNFVAESGRYSGKTIDRKSCNLAIPVQVPSGYQVALISEVSGYVGLKRQGLATYNQELFVAGSRGPIVTRKFKGPDQNRFVVNPIPPLSWSQCGQSTNIRANLSFATQGEAMAIVDEVRFRLHIRSCRQ